MLDLTEVILEKGKVIHRETEITLAELSYKSGTYPVVSREPAILTIENQEGKRLSIEGSTSLAVLIPCARCLEPVTCRLEIRLENELDLKDKDYIDGYNLDVDKLVYGEILLNWPMKVLCREDCKGICSTCGTNLNLGTCDCDSTDIDPRMARIRDIFSKGKEV